MSVKIEVMKDAKRARKHWKMHGDEPFETSKVL